MLRKTIKYTDYNGVERTEDFYFNLSRAEVAEMELGTVGGVAAMLQRVVDAKDVPQIIALFKKIILQAYGEKSLDGKRFMKSAELSEAFSQTEAYTELFLELGGDAAAATAFINGVLPDYPKDAAQPPVQAIPRPGPVT